MALTDLLNDCVELELLGLIDNVCIISSCKRLVCGDFLRCGGDGGENDCDARGKYGKDGGDNFPRRRGQVCVESLKIQKTA